MTEKTFCKTLSTILHHARELGNITTDLHKHVAYISRPGRVAAMEHIANKARKLAERCDKLAANLR